MRLDISYGGGESKTNKQTNKQNTTNSWRSNNTLLNNEEATEEIRMEIKRILETNDNESMMTQNLWDTAKAVLEGKFIGIQSYLKNQ